MTKKINNKQRDEQIFAMRMAGVGVPKVASKFKVTKTVVYNVNYRMKNKLAATTQCGTMTETPVTKTSDIETVLLILVGMALTIAAGAILYSARALYPMIHP